MRRSPLNKKMSSGNYIISLALIAQNNTRAVPLIGKSLKRVIEVNEHPGETGDGLIKDLLIRVFQRSDEGAVQRAAGDASLILIVISMEAMQVNIPLIKSKWINKGDTQNLLYSLKNISSRVWSANYSKGEGIVYTLLK